MGKREAEDNKLVMFLCSILLFVVLAAGRTIMERKIEFHLQISLGWIAGGALVLFLLQLCIHEFGHCIVFKLHHINIQAVFLMFLILVKENGKWKIRLCNWQQMLMGGMVVPELLPIKSEEEYQRVKRAYQKELLGGPMATALFSGIGAGIFFGLSQWAESMKAEALLLGIATIALGLGVLLSALKKDGDDLGDFYAYQRMKRDSIESNQIIILDEQWGNEDGTENYYCVKRADRFLELASQKKGMEIDVILFMTVVLQKALSSERYKLTPIQEQMLQKITETKDWLEHLENETIEVFGYRLVQYSAVCKQDKAYAYQLYKTILEKIRYKREFSDFYQHECEQVLGLKDYGTDLWDRNKMIRSSDWKIWSVLTGYYMEEEKIIARLCKVEVR